MGRSWRLYSRKRESRRGATTKTARKGDTTVVERQHGLVDEGNFVTVVTVRARKQANRITLGGRGRFLTVDLPPDTPRHCSLGYGGQGSTRGDIRNKVSLSLSVTLRGQLARPLNHPSAAIWCSLFRHARGSKLAADVGHKPPGTGTNLPSCHHAIVSPVLNTRP